MTVRATSFSGSGLSKLPKNQTGQGLWPATGAPGLTVPGDLGARGQ